jgi:hypothetical protein
MTDSDSTTEATPDRPKEEEETGPTLNLSPEQQEDKTPPPHVLQTPKEEANWDRAGRELEAELALSRQIDERNRRERAEKLEQEREAKARREEIARAAAEAAAQLELERREADRLDRARELLWKQQRDADRRAKEKQEEQRELEKYNDGLQDAINSGDIRRETSIRERIRVLFEPPVGHTSWDRFWAQNPRCSLLTPDEHAEDEEREGTREAQAAPHPPVTLTRDVTKKHNDARRYRQLLGWASEEYGHPGDNDIPPVPSLAEATTECIDRYRDRLPTDPEKRVAAINRRLAERYREATRQLTNYQREFPEEVRYQISVRKRGATPDTNTTAPAAEANARKKELASRVTKPTSNVISPATLAAVAPAAVSPAPQVGSLRDAAAQLAAALADAAVAQSENERAPTAEGQLARAASLPPPTTNQSVVGSAAPAAATAPSAQESSSDAGSARRPAAYADSLGAQTAPPDLAQQSTDESEPPTRSVHARSMP